MAEWSSDNEGRSSRSIMDAINNPFGSNTRILPRKFWLRASLQVTNLRAIDELYMQSARPLSPHLSRQFLHLQFQLTKAIVIINIINNKYVMIADGKTEDIDPKFIKEISVQKCSSRKLLRIPESPYQIVLPSARVENRLEEHTCLCSHGRI